MKKHLLMNFKRFGSELLLSAAVVSLISCVPKSFKDRDSVFTPEGRGYEIESISQQIDQELSVYPTRFVVPASDGKPSLERAFFFFKTYTSEFTPKNASSTVRNLNITNEHGKDKILYRVSRVLVKEGFRYSISSSVPGDARKSAILAANLAKFIKESRLEVSLLTPSK